MFLQLVRTSRKYAQFLLLGASLLLVCLYVIVPLDTYTISRRCHKRPGTIEEDCTVGLNLDEISISSADLSTLQNSTLGVVIPSTGLNQNY